MLQQDSYAVYEDDRTFYNAMRRNGMRLDPHRGWVDAIAERFAELPQDEMPAGLTERVGSELDAILADLRNGRVDQLVAFADADHDELESEVPGAYLVGGAI